jgi:hypothetical protein
MPPIGPTLRSPNTTPPTLPPVTIAERHARAYAERCEIWHSLQALVYYVLLPMLLAVAVAIACSVIVVSPLLK